MEDKARRARWEDNSGDSTQSGYNGCGGVVRCCGLGGADTWCDDGWGGCNVVAVPFPLLGIMDARVHHADVGSGTRPSSGNVSQLERRDGCAGGNANNEILSRGACVPNKVRGVGVAQNIG